MTPSLSYRAAVAWTLAVTAVLIFGVIALAAIHPPIAKNLLLVGLWEAVVYLGACRVFLQSVARERPARDALALKPAAPALIGSAAALGVALQIPANSLLALAERIHPTPPAVLEERLAQLTPVSAAHGALIFFVVALAVPLVEELFFRGALLGALLGRDSRRSRVVAASAVTAVCFVVAHIDPHVWIALLIVAAALSHLRVVSGSLWPGLALHASFNGLTLLAVFSGNAPRTPVPEMSLTVVLSGWVVAGGLWWLAHRLARRTGPLARPPEAEAS